MRVLVGCEYSGIVRDAFAKLGHDAMSCDILDTEMPGNHYKGDIRDLDLSEFDLLVAHPPCQYLSFAGNRYWNLPGREELRNEAFKFFMYFVNAPVAKICVENPVGLVNREYRKPDQIIHPYFFGEPTLKRTCLWLKNLPALDYSSTILPKPKPLTVGRKGKKYYRTEKLASSKDRSKSFVSIAKAMAKQWG